MIRAEIVNISWFDFLWPDSKVPTVSHEGEASKSTERTGKEERRSLASEMFTSFCASCD